MKIDYPYNPHNKYVSVVDNLLCLHCGRNDQGLFNFKKKHEESFPNYSKWRNKQKKGHGPASGPKLKKTSLSYWTIFFLITPLSTYKEL